MGYASNAVGTINDVATVIGWAREVGVFSFIDAVQFAPHGPIDVQALDCDFLVCSSYKFFGPASGHSVRTPAAAGVHRGVQGAPGAGHATDKWETGTLNHECLAGLVGALEYIAEVGRPFADQYAAMFPGMTGRRLELHAAMAAMQAYERTLAARLLAGLAKIPGIHIYGLTSEEDLVRRVPTVAITLEGWTPRALAEELASVASSAGTATTTRSPLWSGSALKAKEARCASAWRTTTPPRKWIACSRRCASSRRISGLRPDVSYVHSSRHRVRPS